MIWSSVFLDLSFSLLLPNRCLLLNRMASSKDIITCSRFHIRESFAIHFFSDSSKIALKSDIHLRTPSRSLILARNSSLRFQPRRCITISSYISFNFSSLDILDMDPPKTPELVHVPFQLFLFRLLPKHHLCLFKQAELFTHKKQLIFNRLRATI